jgi:galactonate dehydratase
MKPTFTSFEVFRVEAGWRDWLFLQIETSSGVHGDSEFTDSNGSTASLVTAVKEVSSLLVGQEVADVTLIVEALRKKYRQSLPGIMWKAISAVENALWDLQSKIKEKPIQEFFPDRLTSRHYLDARAYWSHCPTTRIRAAEKVLAHPIRTLTDLNNLGLEISNLGFVAFKTNLVGLNPIPQVFMPGFNRNFSYLSQSLPRAFSTDFQEVIDSICKFDQSLEVIIDFNFNVDLTDFLEIQRNLTGQKIRWLEIDFDDHLIYESILNSAEFPICTGENILGLWHYLQLINDSRIEIVSVDLIWNGLSESLKIAHAAIGKGKRVAVHNYYGGLASSMACVFLEMLPEEALELVEFDFDDVPWRDLIVSNPITIENGSVRHVNELGWNNELILDRVDPSLIYYGN